MMQKALAYFPIQKLCFTIRAKTSIALPYFPGYELHGILGKTVRAIYCKTEGQACTACLRRSVCPYYGLCESTFTHIPGARALKDYPRPYVINPTPARVLKRGDSYRFDVVLIGNAIVYTPYVIEAFMEAGRSGVIDSKSNYDLVSVTSGDQIVFQDGQLASMPPPINAAPADNIEQCREVAVSLLTPWHILKEKELVISGIDLTFSLVIKTLATRICNLGSAYIHNTVFVSNLLQSSNCDSCPFGKKVNGCPDREYCNSLKTRAELIKFGDVATKEYEPDQSTMSLKKRKFMRGLYGGVTYRGDIAPFLPLLRLGEKINAGKGTTMGLGKYHLEC